jgi:hypothetical protein
MLYQSFCYAIGITTQLVLANLTKTAGKKHPIPIPNNAIGLPTHLNSTLGDREARVNSQKTQHLFNSTSTTYNFS